MIEAEQKILHDDEPFLFRGENLALDLVNTEVIRRRKPLDLLMTPQDVAHWWQAACRHHPEFAEVRAESEDMTNYDMVLFKDLKSLRAALRAIFSALVAARAPDKQDVDILNDVLRTGYAALDLTEQGDLQPCYRTTDTGKGLVLLPIALSALRLIRSGERKRLHHCENENCILFFYDTTKSATRRWCSLGCMDRARSAQRYREAKQQKTL